MAPRLASGMLLVLLACTGQLLAQSVQDAPVPTSDTTSQTSSCKRAGDSKYAVNGEGQRCLRYSWGLAARASDLGGDAQNFRLRPSLGLEYGRWSLGSLDADDWLGYGGLRKQSSLAYRLSDSEKWHTKVSASLVNLSTGEGLDSLEGGRYTLRARLAVSYQYSATVQVGGDIAPGKIVKSA